MNDTNSEPGDSTPIPYGSAKFPTQEDAAGTIPEPGGLVGPGGRVEANTALLKIGRSAMEEPSGEFNNNSGLMGLGSLDSGSGDETPSEFGEDQMGTEAASARIAQEYRRQVRIKRLAEEIQQAEREKKKDDKLKSGTQIREGTTVRGGELKRKKEETAKISLKETKEGDPEAEALAKKRAEALNAFKSGKGSSKWFAPVAMGLMLVGVIIGSYILYNKITTANEKLKEDFEYRTRRIEELGKVVDPKYAALESRVESERQAREQAEKAAAEERRAREAALKQQEEQARALKEEREILLAEAKRAQEQAAKLEEENRKRNEELAKKAQEASRIAREKMKKEQQGENTPGPLPTETAQGEVRTSPPQPAGIPGKDLPTGAVRLFCKASDPYGGRLTFHWKQLKGAPVDIADPNFSVMKDGKWYSQTYFVAREPGSYEFEVSVKNEDGVETLRKYPIEVLPVTTLK